MKAVRLTIYGRVQGVGFRFSAKHAADALGITGFAQNKPDGSVYIEAESGNEENLEKFVRWCSEGPDFGKVKRIERGDKTYLKPRYHNFSIKY